MIFYKHLQSSWSFVFEGFILVKGRLAFVVAGYRYVSLVFCGRFLFHHHVLRLLIIYLVRLVDFRTADSILTASLPTVLTLVEVCRSCYSWTTVKRIAKATGRTFD